MTNDREFGGFYKFKPDFSGSTYLPKVLDILDDVGYFTDIVGLFAEQGRSEYSRRIGKKFQEAAKDKIFVVGVDSFFSDGNVKVYNLEDAGKHKVLVLLAEQYCVNFTSNDSRTLNESAKETLDAVREAVEMVDILTETNANFMTNEEALVYLAQLSIQPPQD